MVTRLRIYVFKYRNTWDDESAFRCYVVYAHSKREAKKKFYLSTETESFVIQVCSFPLTYAHARAISCVCAHI